MCGIVGLARKIRRDVDPKFAIQQSHRGSRRWLGRIGLRQLGRWRRRFGCARLIFYLHRYQITETDLDLGFMPTEPLSLVESSSGALTPAGPILDAQDPPHPSAPAPSCLPADR